MVEVDGLRESSESLLLLVVEDEDEDIKTPSWINLTIASRDSRFRFYFGPKWERLRNLLKEYLKKEIKERRKVQRLHLTGGLAYHLRIFILFFFMLILIGNILVLAHGNGIL